MCAVLDACLYVLHMRCLPACVVWELPTCVSCVGVVSYMCSVCEMPACVCCVRADSCMCAVCEMPACVLCVRGLLERETSQGYVERPCLHNNKKK